LKSGTEIKGLVNDFLPIRLALGGNLRLNSRRGKSDGRAASASSPV
jgi:hypothetical protein